MEKNKTSPDFFLSDFYYIICSPYHAISIFTAATVLSLYSRSQLLLQCLTLQFLVSDAWAKSRRKRKGALEGNERDSREWGVTDYR